MSDSLFVEATQIYEPVNKEEIRLVYRVRTGPHQGRHQKTYSTAKYGRLQAQELATEARNYINRTHQLPPGFQLRPLNRRKTKVERLGALFSKDVEGVTYSKKNSSSEIINAPKLDCTSQVENSSNLREDKPGIPSRVAKKDTASKDGFEAPHCSVVSTTTSQVPFNSFRTPCLSTVDSSKNVPDKDSVLNCIASNTSSASNNSPKDSLMLPPDKILPKNENCPLFSNVPWDKKNLVNQSGNVLYICVPSHIKSYLFSCCLDFLSKFHCVVTTNCQLLTNLNAVETLILQVDENAHNSDCILSHRSTSFSDSNCSQTCDGEAALNGAFTVGHETSPQNTKGCKRSCECSPTTGSINFSGNAKKVTNKGNDAQTPMSPISLSTNKFLPVSFAPTVEAYPCMLKEHPGESVRMSELECDSNSLSNLMLPPVETIQADKKAFSPAFPSTAEKLSATTKVDLGPAALGTRKKRKRVHKPLSLDATYTEEFCTSGNISSSEAIVSSKELIKEFPHSCEPVNRETTHANNEDPKHFLLSEVLTKNPYVVSAGTIQQRLLEPTCDSIPLSIESENLNLDDVRDSKVIRTMQRLFSSRRDISKPISAFQNISTRMQEKSNLAFSIDKPTRDNLLMSLKSSCSSSELSGSFFPLKSIAETSRRKKKYSEPSNHHRPIHLHPLPLLLTPIESSLISYSNVLGFEKQEHNKSEIYLSRAEVYDNGW